MYSELNQRSGEIIWCLIKNFVYMTSFCHLLNTVALNSSSLWKSHQHRVQEYRCGCNGKR
ncbi:hypothetical protein HMPREF1346_02577 [Enterococcus faecium 503]|nr:hypothetical protein HMPREF1346_02577 [Enterococcus faecium 503]